MFNSFKNRKEGNSVIFQKSKLHIDNIEPKGDLDAFETELHSFLSRYGKIIGLKVMLNSWIIRTQQKLRAGDFQRWRKRRVVDEYETQFQE